MMAYFNKLLAAILSNNFMKKLRVFHLILGLIIIMITFLMVQGYLGVQNIDTMQQVNQKMFDTSMQFMKDINTIKSNILFIRENYLKRLAGLADRDSLDYAFKTIEDNLTKVQQITKSTATDTRISELVGDPSKQLDASIIKLKKLAYAADTRENFLECEAVLFQAIKHIDNIQKQVDESSYNTSTYSKRISKNQKQLTIIFLIISTLMAVFVGLLLYASISWPLKEIIKYTRKMAKGDLTGNIRPFGCQESSEVVNELVDSIGSLRLLIGNINRQSEKIANASENLKTAAQDSGRSAEEVARAMQEISQAASNQSDQITQTVQIVSILGETVRKVSYKTLNIANTSEGVANSAKNGQKVTNDVACEINEIYVATQKIGEVIRELNGTTQEISEITAEIQEIAEQTSLLSLNAAIEAARAGEQGKGFSVVAKETGKLAERSKIAANKIAAHTAQMIKRTGQTVELMEQGILRVEKGKNLADEATVTFEGIFNQLKEVLEKINEVAKSAQEMSRYNEEVISAISNIAAISEESMASTEEVSASAQEQSAGTEEVSAQSETLLQISREIKQSAAVFIIEND